MNVSLTPDLEKLVKEKVQTGQYPNAAAVVEEALQLLRDRDAAETRLETALKEGIESGDSSEMTKDEWEQMHHEVRQRHARMKAK